MKWLCFCLGNNRRNKEEKDTTAFPPLDSLPGEIPYEITYRGLSEQGTSQARRQSITEEKRGVAVVELAKKEGCNLGLVITGGADKDERPQVSCLRPGGVAERSDVLQEGDFILAVNGIRTTHLRHEEIINLLKNTGEDIMFELEYELPDPPQDTFSVICKRVEVTLVKDTDSFGFTLRGGVQEDIDKTRPLTITNIRRGSAADRDGTLKVGDRLLCINGMNVTQCSQLDVLHLFKHTDEVTLLIEYDVSVMESVQNASGPLLIEVERQPGTDLGVTLTNTVYKGKPVIGVEAIKPASIVDRSGALHVGDHILAIDETSVEHVTVAEALQLLKSGTGPLVKLEILPAHKGRTKPLSHSSSRSSILSNGHPAGTVPNKGDPYGSLRRNSDGKPSALNRCSRTSGPKRNNAGNIPLAEVTNVAGQLLAMQAALFHPERTEVVIQADRAGLGFTVTADSLPGVPVTDLPYINHIEPKGAASRTGVLREGDRVISINGEIVENKCLEDVQKMIVKAGDIITMETEYDVADSVIPNSGIFNVKLAKRGSGLGITIRAHKRRKLGEPMLISAVKKGSVAHRTGTIQAGDKLLAINNLRTDQCSLEEAAQVLQDTEEVVKLKIKKAEPVPESREPKNSVTYTVELRRHGGPLGITISGTEERFDPIFISGLAEGGLAENTGALHIGDRILAINGTSLWGRPLSDAIRMLQQADDIVTLKVSRPTNTKQDGEGSLERIGTPIPSVDSALESWDSSDSQNKMSTKSSNKDTDSGTRSCQGGTFDDLRNELRLEDEEWESQTRSSAPPSRTSSIDQPDEDLAKTPKNDGIPNLPTVEILERIDSGIPSDISEINVRGDFEHLGYASGDIDDFDHLDLLENLSDISENFSTSSKIVAADVHLQEVDEQLQTIFKPTPVELLRVTLYKWKDGDDFGFGLSEGVYEKGVYISAVRPGGPADKCGTLRAYDKILQVNGVKTKDLDCGQVVPLIADTGNVLEMVVSRNPLASHEQRSEDIWIKRDERSLRGQRV